MRYFFYFILIACFSGYNSKNSNRFDLVITNVNLIDGTGKPMQKNVWIGIKDGIIKSIDSEQVNTKPAIDGTGKYLIPGLFDCHVHTADYERDFPRFMHYGITSVFITGGSLCTNIYYASMRKLGNQYSIPAPYVFHTSQHFSMEGRHPSKTYHSSNWHDGETIFYLRDTNHIENLVQEVSQFPVVGIKLTIEDGPHSPFVERMPEEFIIKTVKEAEKAGLEVFAHVSDNIELEMAINAGVQNLLHFTGVDIDPQDHQQMALLEKFRKINPSWVTTLMIDKSFLYPLHPEWFTSEAMLPEYRDMINKISPNDIERSKKYVHFLLEEYDLKENSLAAFILPQVADIRFLSYSGFQMVLGTDTGNDFNFPGYSLHEEMQLLELGGMSPVDIIKMGTLNAAEMLSAQDSLGSIELGKIANMILLDKNPTESISNTLSINTVIKKGEIQKRMLE